MVGVLPVLERIRHRCSVISFLYKCVSKTVVSAIGNGRDVKRLCVAANDLQVFRPVSEAAMSNIAGKVYAMNVITPIKWYVAWINKFIFWLGGTRLFQSRLSGLLTLSLIHYARWVVLKPSNFPRLDESQSIHRLLAGSDDPAVEFRYGHV